MDHPQHVNFCPVPYNHEDWLRRVLHSSKLALVVMAVALSIGVLSYHFIGKLPWVDALLEASMILGGMGPIAPMQNDAIKIFASCYALASGLLIIGTMGVILAPWIQRLIHHPHWREQRKAQQEAKKATLQ